jgi:sugar/nucleoside kinase (ribokinase family)
LVSAKDHLKILSKEGQNGATLLSKNEENLHGAAFQEMKSKDGLSVVNTTGAGDTFTAAYAVKSDLEFAAAAAFLCICKNGAAESIPTESEV